MRALASIVFFAAFAFVLLPSSSASADTAEKRGCCSHHGGVCGCSGGHTMCCDGGMSPSCSCRAD